MTLTEAVKATYAAIGQSMTDIELALIVADLSTYQPAAVMTALTRCRRELKRLTPSDIIDRMPGAHPGAEEAWSMLQAAIGNEAATIVWTEEMREAYGVVAPLADDPIAARMAFKETYGRLVGEARARGQLVRWSVSLGHDPHQRQSAIEAAVAAGRLTHEEGRRMCPALPPATTEAVRMLEGVTHGLPAMPSAD